MIQLVHRKRSINFNQVIIALLTCLGNGPLWA